MIATTAFAALLLPALHANDTPNPAANKTDETLHAAATSAIDKVGKIDEPEATEPAAPIARRGVLQMPASVSPQAASSSKKSSMRGSVTPKVEWFVGYSYWRATPFAFGNRMVDLHGGSTSVAFNLTRSIGIVGDFGGYRISKFGPGAPPDGGIVDADGHAFSYLIGPRFSYRSEHRFTPFAQVLLGGVHASDVSLPGCSGLGCRPLPSENVFALTAGIGLDLELSRHFSLRLIQAEYLMTYFVEPDTQRKARQDNVRLSTGLVYRFGGAPPPPPPNNSPSASCSADKSMVYVGTGDVVVVRAQASDPDNDPLTYTWSATGGAAEGTGPEVRWNSTGAAAGTYTVRTQVSDGRGGTADCSAEIRVEQRPNRPPTITCSADRNSVFAGERVHITCNANDPDGDPLTYSWRANAGQIVGNGPNGDYDTTGLAPGNYTVTTRVDDGRGGAADAATGINVKPTPPAPQASKINECAFGGAASARIDNVCKRILDDVALRLQNEPKGTAVIIGYSDPKERKPDATAGDRAGNAAKYLSEKGIDGSRIKTRVGSGQVGANQKNRRIEVIWVPEGATY